MFNIKTEDAYEDFSSDKEMLNFSSCLAQSECYDKKKLFAGKIKNEIGAATSRKFVGLKSRMYSFLVDDSSKQQKRKGCE